VIPKGESRDVEAAARRDHRARRRSAVRRLGQSHIAGENGELRNAPNSVRDTDPSARMHCVASVAVFQPAPIRGCQIAVALRAAAEERRCRRSDRRTDWECEQWWLKVRLALT
jgi:hypothetical protein